MACELGTPTKANQRKYMNKIQPYETLKFDNSKEYALSILNKNICSIELLRKLSHEEATIIFDLMDKRAKYDYLENKINEVILNFKDFNNFLSASDNEDSEQSRKLAFVQINRLFLNFLNSWKIFIEFTDKFYKRNFGKNSNEVEELTKISHRLFDDNFSYRFFSKLRNYSEHEYYPIYAIRTDGKGNKEAFFDKKTFINEKSYFPKKHFEKDWNLFHDYFPVLPQCIEGIKLLQIILDCYQKENNTFNDYSNKINEIIEGLYDNKSEYYMTELNQDFLKSRFQLIQNVTNNIQFI